MAIGANWAEIWADVWGPVWTQTAAEPEVEQATQAPAGSSQRKRRTFVEIDGAQFEVNSQAEAIELLQRARAIAEHQAEVKAKVAESNVERIARRTGTVPKVNVPAPEIKVSPDLNVGSLIADIQRLYRQAGEMAELRILIQRQLDDEDDETLLLL